MAMCAVGPLAGFRSFQSGGGKKRQQGRKMEGTWKLEKVQREDKINVVSGYLLKCMNIPYVIKCSCELQVKTTT